MGVLVCCLTLCDPFRSALASAHQRQPLPTTLSVMESTPQVRGMHTIIRSDSTHCTPESRPQGQVILTVTQSFASRLSVKEQGDEQRRVYLLLQEINEAPDRTRPVLSASQGEFWCPGSKPGLLLAVVPSDCCLLDSSH